MSVVMYTYLRTQVVEKKMEVASTVQPYEGEPCASCSLKFSLMRLCFVFHSEIYIKSG